MTSPTSSAAAQTPLTASTNSPRGRFLWHELLARDADAALRFYPGVASWTTTAMAPMEGMPPYSMFVNGEMPVAGVMALPDEEQQKGVPANWLPYMGTADVDATFKEALALGATGIMAPRDIPTVGRIAILIDPQGATFAIYAPSETLNAEEGPKNGEFSWHELATTDREAAFDFYSRLFGWKKTEAMDMGAEGIYQMFGREQFTYGGVYSKPAFMPVSNWNCYIQVSDLDRACDVVRRNGGTIVRGPEEVPGGDRIVNCIDDQGAAFSLHGKK